MFAIKFSYRIYGAVGEKDFWERRFNQELGNFDRELNVVKIEQDVLGGTCDKNGRKR